MNDIIKISAATLFLISFSSAATDQVNFDVTGKILKGTCSFVSDSIIFDLGNVEISEFQGVGTKTPWVNQSLVSAGCDADVTGLNMTFQATADTDAANLFAVTGGASGVAVELQAVDNTPAIPDNTTVMSWAPQPSGSPYGFKARYSQTKATVVPGDANANIIVNIAYP